MRYHCKNLFYFLDLFYSLKFWFFSLKLLILIVLSLREELLLTQEETPYGGAGNAKGPGSFSKVHF